MPRPSVREEIVQSALEQFHRNGFNGTSVDDITRSAGVPKGSFYNHFKGKEELAHEVLDRFASAQPMGLLLQKDVPALRRLKRYFTALAEGFIAGGCKQGCMLGNFSTELVDHSAGIRRDVNARFAGWVELLAGVIREGQRSGEIPGTQKPEQLAGFLLSAWEGTLLRARAASDPAIVKDFLAIAFNHLLT
jgi:TetR/AcrR family transcriptional regulator, transcriptional repressor for nem operon